MKWVGNLCNKLVQHQQLRGVCARVYTTSWSNVVFSFNVKKYMCRFYSHMDTTMSSSDLVIHRNWRTFANVHCPCSRLTLGEMLGEGAFGMVVKAEAKGISGKNGAQTVAVKMLKGGCLLSLPLVFLQVDFSDHPHLLFSATSLAFWCPCSGSVDTGLDSTLKEPGFEFCAERVPLASLFTLHCSSSLVCTNEYLAIDTGCCLHYICHCHIYTS